MTCRQLRRPPVVTLGADLLGPFPFGGEQLLQAGFAQVEGVSSIPAGPANAWGLWKSESRFAFAGVPRRSRIFAGIQLARDVSAIHRPDVSLAIVVLPQDVGLTVAVEVSRRFLVPRRAGIAADEGPASARWGPWRRAHSPKRDRHPRFCPSWGVSSIPAAARRRLGSPADAAGNTACKSGGAGFLLLTKYRDETLRRSSPHQRRESGNDDEGLGCS
jgi:hypothetical protein